MYTALYRAERPEVFDEILGQEHILKILKHQIQSDTVSHAYLFCGTRGTGKTTTARILAKAVNCLDEDKANRPCGRCAHCRSIKDGIFMDVIEIDAASNNGVDNIRELRESVKYPPSAGRKKVYIIDEVHMLTTGAFNALLKTLEEPPENVMFILATTEPQKLPATILSRCMRLDFKRVPQNLLMEGMKRICSDKGVEITDSALRLLANCADGSVRDGLSILDQVLASGEKKIERSDVLEYIGSAGEEFYIELTELVSLHKVPEALVMLDSALSEGKDAKQLMKDWTAHYRNLMVTKFIKNPEDMLNMSAENIEKIEEQSRHISLEEINNGILRLSRAINDARWSTQPRILLELAMVAIATGLLEDEDRIGERRNGNGQAAGRVTSQAQPSWQMQIQPQRNLAGQQAGAGMPVMADAAAGVPVNPQRLEGKNVDENYRPSELQSSDRLPDMQSVPVTAGAADYNPENDALWHTVFEQGEDEEGSFNLIRTGTSLVHVGQNEFTITAKSAFAKKFAEQKKDQLESLMERNVGRRMRMVCIEEREWAAMADKSFGMGSDSGNSKDQEMARLVEEAGKELGIDITLE